MRTLLPGLLALLLALPTWAGDSLDDVPGVVVAYEKSPHLFKWALGKARYLGSPSLARLPNGHYVATHDYFRRGGGGTGPKDADGVRQGITMVYRSTDQGQTWQHVARIEPSFWATVFHHDNALYLFGYPAFGGTPLVRRSTDEGRTWTTPTDPTNGIVSPNRAGGAPNPPVYHAGRLWIGAGRSVFSAHVGADLLRADSWTRSRGVAYDKQALPQGDGWFEGCVVASPRTGVVLMPKTKAVPYSVLLSFNDPAGRPTYDPARDIVSFPGGEKKFSVFYDDVTDRFYALSNPVLAPHEPDPNWRPSFRQLLRPEQNRSLIRNAGALYSSPDLRTWSLERVFLYDPDVCHVAFQYLTFQVEGSDLLVLSRTAWNVGIWKIPRGHDSNLLTFHRIANFRQTPADPYPPKLKRELRRIGRNP